MRRNRRGKSGGNAPKTGQFGARIGASEFFCKNVSVAEFFGDVSQCINNAKTIVLTKMTTSLYSVAVRRSEVATQYCVHLTDFPV